MKPFLALISTGGEYNSSAFYDECWNGLTTLNKSIFLIRQAFAVEYVKLLSNQFSRSKHLMIDAYRTWLKNLICDVKACNASGNTDHVITEILDTAWTVLSSNINTCEIGRYHPTAFASYLETPVAGVPCRMDKEMWMPFYLYCQYWYNFVQWRNNKSGPKPATPKMDSAYVVIPQLSYRRITLHPYMNNMQPFSVEMQKDHTDKSEIDYGVEYNVFDYLSMFDWGGRTFSYVSGVLAKLSLTRECNDILGYLQDCIFYDGKCDPVMHLDDYIMSPNMSKAFTAFVTKLKTRDKIEFDNMEVVTRLLLVDNSGQISKRLYEHLQTSVSEEIEPSALSTEALKSSNFGFMTELYMQKEDEEGEQESEEEKPEEPESETEEEETPEETPTEEETPEEDPDSDTEENEDTGDIEEESSDIGESSDDSEFGGGEGETDAPTEPDEPLETSVKIGDVTLKMTGPPSMRSNIVREKISRYLDYIIDVKPKGFDADEIELLRRIRVHWLYLWHIDTTLELLNKVLVGKRLPKLKAR